MPGVGLPLCLGVLPDLGIKGQYAQKFLLPDRYAYALLAFNLGS
jgi:hypothetical protein